MKDQQHQSHIKHVCTPQIGIYLKHFFAISFWSGVALLGSHVSLPDWLLKIQMGFWGTNRSLTERKGKRGLMRRSRFSGSQKGWWVSCSWAAQRAWGDGLREQRSWGCRGQRRYFSDLLRGWTGGRVRMIFGWKGSFSERGGKKKKERKLGWSSWGGSLAKGGETLVWEETSRVWTLSIFFHFFFLLFTLSAFLIVSGSYPLLKCGYNWPYVHCYYLFRLLCSA